MNKKFKLGLTALTAGALVFSSVAAFADTSAVTNFVKGGHQGVLEMMLKDGVVTQTQIDQYEQKIQDEHTAAVKTELQALVTKGTLTQEKADAVLKALSDQQAKMEAEHEKMSKMTETELKAYFEANKTTVHTDPLQALVTAGTLTAADLTAVRTAVGPMGGPGHMEGPGHMGKGGHLDNRMPMNNGKAPASAPAKTTTATDTVSSSTKK